MQTAAAAENFLSQRRIAVTGVSRTPKGHGSNVVYRRLRERGYEAVAINPHATTVEGDPCFPSLHAVPGGIDAVVIGTRPDRALDTVGECIELGVRHLWMHRGLGAGSVSAEATALARQHGMLVIDGGCPCMFGATADPFHRFVKALQGVRGKLPSDVQDERPVDFT
ncbi:MAG: CoA-binding domain protein [Frankiales bacterium]|nr:CoA-binding domain protein [Frankiales bacterium]